LQVEVNVESKSLVQVAGHETSLPGKTQSVETPSHFFVPQRPEPPQEDREVVTALQVPTVCLHDWHCPVHCELQQTPSETKPLAHSKVFTAVAPLVLRAAHFPVVVSQ
jgi:hypothetical protein